MIQWQSKSIPISELKDYEHNPRRISKKEFEKLVRCLKEDGYHQRIIVNSDYTILGGHQRKKALLAAGFKESDEVEVLCPNRMLTPEEIDRINIRDNLLFGEYDFDVLANRFEVDQLLDFGMPEDWLQSLMGETSEVDESGDYPQSDVEIWRLGEHTVTVMADDDLEYAHSILESAKPVTMIIDKKHLKMIIKVWEKYSGQKAIKYGDEK